MVKNVSFRFLTRSTSNQEGVMPPNHFYDKRGIDRRLLLIGATLTAGSALASGVQMLSARAEGPTSDDRILAQLSEILLEVQREPSATGYPRPLTYAD
jgi:hypothetical protein